MNSADHQLSLVIDQSDLGLGYRRRLAGRHICRRKHKRPGDGNQRDGEKHLGNTTAQM